MTIEQTLIQRSDNKCELCTANNDLSVYELPPVSDADSDKCVLLCVDWKDQIEQSTDINVNHWRCLNDSMWSQTPAVQVMAWRMLNRLKSEGWAQDLLDMMYLEEGTITINKYHTHHFIFHVMLLITCHLSKH